MKEDDLGFVNKVRNDRKTRHFLKNSKKISIKDTIEWYRTQKPNWKIIEVEGEKVGYIRVSADTGETICIGCDIHPSHRRKGYARKAYETLINNLYEKGYIVIWLEVFRDNIPAISLYCNLGFVEVGFRLLKEKDYVAMVHRRKNER